MLLLRVLSLLSLFAANIRASSHWMVTESGLIQSKDNSPFLLSNPFDLVSFMNQETRWQNTFNIYDNLLSRKELVNNLWIELEEQSDVTSHIAGNEYCKAVGDIGNLDWYTTVAENGTSLGIREREFMLYAIEEFGETDVPDCNKISSLTFSMSTFEHLEGMMMRRHLNATPETALAEIFSSVRTVDQYGHWLSMLLRRNTTSWLHYNLASIFWRIKGDMPKALECSRRAVHYAPRRFKSIPLICMGSILHRSKKTEDAIIVLEASIDHSPTFPPSHFALGEAYAVAGDFNNSLKHLNTSIKLCKGYSHSLKYQKAVLCHIDMLNKMQYTQRTMNKLAVEIEEYRDMESQWYQIHAALLKAMEHDAEYSYTNIETNCIKMEEITNLNIKDLQRDRNRTMLLHLLVTNPQYNVVWKNAKGVNALEIAFELDRAVKDTAKRLDPANKSLKKYSTEIDINKLVIIKEMGPKPSFPDIFPEPIKFPDKDESGVSEEAEVTMTFQLPEETLTEHVESDLSKKPDRKVLYPPNMKISRNKMDFDKEWPQWPKNDFCHEAKSTFPDNMEVVYPVFLPFEHKGISLQGLLTDKIGVSAREEHELPWHPPLCPSDKDLALYTSKKGIKVKLVPKAISEENLRRTLVKYVSPDDRAVAKNMQDAEIGQRIYAAMQKKVAPKWLLYTLASLYWRVRSNSINALNCLLSAQRAPNNKHPDVVLVSLSSVLVEMGLWDDAYLYADMAYKLNPYEPPTNFLLAQLHMIQKQQKAQLFHYKQVLRVEPQYMGGLARCIFNSWACITKQVMLLKELGDFSADEDCGESDPGTQSWLCELDGSNCRAEKKNCEEAEADSSTLVRVMKADHARSVLFTQKHLETNFNKVLNAKPLARHDKAAHLKSYDLMMRTVAEQLDLCKNQQCGVTIEDFHMKKEECIYNLFEFKYWVHYVGFQQELSESEQKIADDIATMTPSHKKTPVCAVPAAAEGDFFLSRVLAAETEEWGALLALVEHFADLFDHNDYILLGGKIAKYVETHGDSWWGAMAAGWWCGAVGRGACAVRCFAAAHALAPTHLARRALRPLIAYLHLQNKNKDAMDIAYLAFYASPKSKAEAFLVGQSHYFNKEMDEALWMYRYALALDYTYIPASASLQSVMCHLIFSMDGVTNPHQTPT